MCIIIRRYRLYNAMKRERGICWVDRWVLDTYLECSRDVVVVVRIRENSYNDDLYELTDNFISSPIYISYISRN